MRVGELSSRTGVPVPTIKYYLREGLLTAGVRTGPNQAHYDEGHVRRLRLIRALVEIGGLSIAAARSVLGHLDDTTSGTFATLGKVQYALMERHTGDAGEQVDELLDRLGWTVRPDNPARGALAEVLSVLDRLGRDDVLSLVERYAAAAHGLAAAEVDVVLARPSAEDRAEAVVVGAVLGDRMLTALRRLAQEDQVARRLGGGAPAEPSGGDQMPNW